MITCYLLIISCYVSAWPQEFVMHLSFAGKVTGYSAIVARRYVFLRPGNQFPWTDVVVSMPNRFTARTKLLSLSELKIKFIKL
jgi:hypothetical protein